MSKEKPDAFDVQAPEEQVPSTGNPAPAPVVPTTAPMTRLASFFVEEFRVNAEHRRMSGVDAMLERAGRAMRMKYAPEQEAILRQSGIGQLNYRPLTLMKMRAARAMLTDIIKQSGDKFYVLSPTPSPTVPESATRKILSQIAQEIVALFGQRGWLPFQDPQEIAAFYVSIIMRVAEMHDEMRRREMEWARVRCDRMDQLIHDQLVEGGFIEAFNAVVGYICAYGTAVMVGPTPRVEASQKCREVEGIDGAVKYTREYVVRPVYEAVSPWDCYPAPNAKRIGDGTFCMKVRYTADALWQYAEAETKGRPEGWQAATVRALLSQHPKGGVRLELDSYDLVRREMERDTLVTHDDCTLEGIRCFASVRGSMLIGFGIARAPDGEKIVYHRYYKTEAVVIAGYVVYCRIIDDRMALPLAKVCLYETPDSWWGDSLADILYSAQNLQNNALKNIILNGALSSNGMFVCSAVNRVVSLDGSPALAIRAGKMFGFKESAAGTGAPLNVLTVPDTTQSQLTLLKAASEMADDDSGIPQYTIGSSRTLTGAGRTASGLAMMSEAACRVINMAICDLGLNLIIPVVRNTHVYNLLESDDMSVKGDVEVNPSGLMGKILREAESQRRIQFTTMLGTHPVYSRALTVEAFFELLRPELDSLGVNPDRIIPSKERMAFIQQMMDAQASAQQAAQQEQGAGGGEEAHPSPEQANVARVEGQPQQVANGQSGGAAPGTVAERRNVA